MSKPIIISQVDKISTIPAADLSYVTGLTSSAQTQLNNKAGLPSSITCTLTAAGWTGSAAPFTNTVTVTGMTATKVGTFGLATTATSAQYAAAAGAQLLVTAQAEDSITVTAYGDKPTVDIPCVVNIVG